MKGHRGQAWWRGLHNGTVKGGNDPFCDAVRASHFSFFGWHLEAFALEHDTLLLAVCRKLMGLRQRLTQMTFEWAKHLSLLGFGGGQSQFRVHSVCSEVAQWGATRDWSLFFLWHLTALFKTRFIRNMQPCIWSQELCHGCHLSHQDGAARRSPAGRDVHARLHMKGPQSATVSNGNGTFL